MPIVPFDCITKSSTQPTTAHSNRLNNYDDTFLRTCCILQSGIEFELLGSERDSIPQSLYNYTTMKYLSKYNIIINIEGPVISVHKCQKYPLVSIFLSSCLVGSEN